MDPQRERPPSHGVLPFEIFYDAALYDEYTERNTDDIEFYLTEARRAGDPILELGAGTGRVTIEIAHDGYQITALDIDAGMIARGQENAEKRLPPALQKNLTWAHGNMAEFDLAQQFNLIIIPFRAFQHLLSADDQLRCLACCQRHLAPGGRLIIAMFDPKIAALASTERQGVYFGVPIRRAGSFRRQNGNEVIIYATRHEDLAEQILSEDWVFEEISSTGTMVSRRHRQLKLRWTYRYEMEHLFARAGFRVTALFGDFRRGKFVHGGEQIWIATPTADVLDEQGPAGTGEAV